MCYVDVRVELVVQVELAVEVVALDPARQPHEEHPASWVWRVARPTGDVADFGPPFVENAVVLCGHDVGHGDGDGVGGPASVQVDVVTGQYAAELGHVVAVAFPEKKEKHLNYLLLIQIAKKLTNEVFLRNYNLRFLNWIQRFECTST